MSLRIDPNGLPVDGLHLEGHLPPGVFGLKPEDASRAVSPLEYDLTVTRDENDLFVQGWIAATFDLECGRCAERFESRVALDPYVLDVPIEKQTSIDLTTWLREDMLLALPTFPRCESGNVTPRKCPAEGRFDPAGSSTRNAPPKEETDVWKALDQLDNLKRN
jgi:uncharacterized metal-binding protein YceD (DUF177 family)